MGARLEGKGLVIRVTDLLAGKSIMRDVHFTVGL